MTRIARPPAIAQINLEPCAEIHRSVGQRNLDVAQIARHVAGGDVHAAAKCKSEMLKIPAHPEPLGIHIERRLRGPRERITERDLLMHPIAYALNACPSRLR